jgi:hypothetical protein
LKQFLKQQDSAINKSSIFKPIQVRRNNGSNENNGSVERTTTKTTTMETTMTGSINKKECCAHQCLALGASQLGRHVQQDIIDRNNNQPVLSTQQKQREKDQRKKTENDWWRKDSGKALP